MICSRVRFAGAALLLVAACDCGGDNQLITRFGEGRVEPTSIDFGDVMVGGQEVRAGSIQNVGDFPLTIDDIGLTDPNSFTIAQGLADRLEPNEKGTLAVVFAPTGEGEYAATLEIYTDGVVGTHQIQLTGRGVVPPPSCALTVSPSPVQYGPVQVGSSADETVVIANDSAGDCQISRIEVVGDGASDFALLDTNPGAVAPGGQVSIGVRFSRSVPQDRVAFLEIESNDASTPVHRIPLLAGETRPGLCVMPAMIHFGVTSGSATRDITLTACGDHDVAIQGLDFTTANAEIGLVNPPALPFTLPVGSSQVVTVSYSPSDQMDDRAVLTVRSDDPLVPSVDVEITGSPDIVPEEVGRFIYFWQVDGTDQSNIIRVPLQGGGAPGPYWGQSTGQTGCPGCHQVSPDGRYVAVVEFDNIFMRTYVIDTRTDTQVTLPLQTRVSASFSWRPDVNTSPPYQYAVGVLGDIRIGSIGGGYIGPLAGADDPNLTEAMPSWGPNGEIVVVRGESDPLVEGFGFLGATDLIVIPEGGGAATPLPGASNNGYGNFYPAYSPSGRWISYTESRAGGSTYAAPDAQVRMVAADRSGTVLDLAAINGNDGATSFPTWSMDGSYLSVSSNRSGGVGSWDIYIVPMDEATGQPTGPVTNLPNANTPGFEHAAQWSP